MRVRNVDDSSSRTGLKAQLSMENDELKQNLTSAQDMLSTKFNAEDVLLLDSAFSGKNRQGMDEPAKTASLVLKNKRISELNEIFNLIADPVFILDSDGKVLACSNSTIRQYNFRTGVSVFKLMDEYDVKILEPAPASELLKEAKNRKLENVQINLIAKSRVLDIVFSSAPFTINNNESVIVVTFRDVTNRTYLENALQESESRYRIMGEMIPYGVYFCDKNGGLKYASSSFLNMIQMTMEEARDFGWTRKMVTEDSGPIINRWLACVKTGEEWEAEPRFVSSDNSIVTILSRARPVRDKNGEISGWAGINLDITERRRMEEDLRNIEWLLTKDLECPNSAAFADPYKEIVDKSTAGEILSSTGEDFLQEITSDYLSMLETSGIVMEQNGLPAITFFRSEWCRFLHSASKALCGEMPLRDAMNCGKWLCHQSCFKQSAQAALNSGYPVDIECAGGIRIYAVPVKAGSEIIGAISFSYGDPPKEDTKLKEIAARYNVGKDKLFLFANAYKSRPRFIVETSKNRLHSSARKIGTIVERKRAEIALQKAYSEIEKRIESRTIALTRSYELLKEEIRVRMRAEKEFSQRNDALEAIYAMATAFSASLEATIDQGVLSVSTMLDVPVVALACIGKEDFKSISQITGMELTHMHSVQIDKHPCGIAYREQRCCQISSSFSRLYPVYAKDFPDMQSYVGIPILNSKGQILGTICAIDKKEHVFDEYEIHLIEIFARYIGTEIERKNMENQLLQSQEMKMLGQLTSGVAHEVRNPLNGILAITDALSKDLGENTEYRTYIEHIRKQVIRLSDLMRDLLDLGRPVERSSLMPTSVNWLVSAAVNMWQHSSIQGERQVRLQSSKASEKLKIYAERAKMEQVIINLLENACSHSSPDKEIVVNVQDADGSVIIQVIDQGTGIKPENVEHLFEPFFTTRKGGTGLGLGIVKRIVESHGGVVEIRNNLSFPGVTAEIRLPVIEAGSDERL